MERSPGWIRGIQIGLGVFCFAVLLFAYVRLQPHTFSVWSPPVETLAPHEHGEEDAIEDTGHGLLLASSATTTEDMWVTGIDVKVRNAPFSVVHHVILSSEEGPDGECPGTPILKDYIAVGQDTPSSFSFPKPYAMFIKKGTVLRMSTMLHNPEKEGETGTTFRNVHVDIALTFSKSSRERNRDVRLIRIAVQDTPYCDKDPKGPGFTVPAQTIAFEKFPKQNEKDRGRFVFNTPGILLSGYGHVHGWDGGKKVSLELNGAPIALWKTERLPEPAEDGRLWSTPLQELALPIHAGDRASVHGEYENTSDVALRGAMAAARLFFSPDP